MRPVEVKRTITVKRPVLVPKRVPGQAPVQTVDLVNITQPQLSNYEMDVQACIFTCTLWFVLWV